MCLKKNGAGFIWDSAVPDNVCFAFSLVCSAGFVFICYDQYLHNTPGHAFFFFKDVEI